MRRPVDIPNYLPPAAFDNGVDAPPVDPGPAPPRSTPSETSIPTEDFILPGFDDQGYIRSIPAVQPAIFSQEVADGIPMTGDEINIVYEVAEDYSVTDEDRTDILEPPANIGPSSFDTVADGNTVGRRNPLR